MVVVVAVLVLVTQLRVQDPVFVVAVPIALLHLASPWCCRGSRSHSRSLEKKKRTWGSRRICVSSPVVVVAATVAVAVAIAIVIVAIAVVEPVVSVGRVAHMI